MSTPQSEHDLLVSIDTKVSLLVAQAEDHEARIRRVESWKSAQEVRISTLWAVAGVSGTSLVTSLVAVVVAVITGR